jgi:LemA protein
MAGLWIDAVIGGLLLVLLIGVMLYNRFVKRRALVAEAWSGIDVQLKRRYDLIPNLVETVKAYRVYEARVLSDLTELRAKTQTAAGPAERGRIEGALSDRLYGLFAVAENYPELKANTVFLDLQERLTQVEDELQLARRYYNGSVRNLNILVESFPSLIVARLFGFARAEYFQLDDAAERAAPPVKV